MISNTFNFLLTLKNRPIHWQTLYMQHNLEIEPSTLQCSLCTVQN